MPSLKIYQHTLAGCVSFDGIGVHSGVPVRLSIHPADADTGIVFHAVDGQGRAHEIRAISANVAATDLSTVIGDPAGVHVATIEHLMAALYALGVDNAIISIEGREIPIMDGCSAAFVAGIDSVGLVEQGTKRRYIRVLKSVRVDHNGGSAEYVPHQGHRFEIDIDFKAQAIGRQRIEFDLDADLFRRELSRARTFGFMKDVERLWAAGFALGSSLENSVVVGDDETVINPGGLRYENEFVRHKALDAVGDQSLAGARIIGTFRSYRGGHRLNAMALGELLSDSRAYELMELPAPRRRSGLRHAPLAAAAAPAFSPQTL